MNATVETTAFGPDTTPFTLADVDRVLAIATGRTPAPRPRLVADAVVVRATSRATERAAPRSTPCGASPSIWRAAVSRRSWAPRARASRPSCTSWPASTSRRAAPSGSTASRSRALKERQLTQLRRDKIGFIFQTFNLLPMLTAAREPRAAADHRRPQVRRRAGSRTLVRAVDLGDRLDHRPAELSGGQQQRVAIARALVSRPVVIFADEPTGNLDSKTGDEVLGLLRRSADEFGQTIVMVTHDARAATVADRIVFLQDGRIELDCGRMSRDEIYDTIKSLEATSERAAAVRRDDPPVAARPVEPQAAHGPDHAGDRARRRHDRRHLRHHRPDQQRLSTTSSRRRPVGTDVNITRKAAFQGQDAVRLGRLAAGLDARPGAGRERRGRRGRQRRGQRRRGRERQVGQHRRRAHARLLDRAAAFQSEQRTSPARGRRATAQSRSTPSWPTDKHLHVGDTIGLSTEQGVQPVVDLGHLRFWQLDLDRRRHARRHDGGRRPALVRPRGPVLEHRRRRRAGRHARHAGGAPEEGAARLRRGQDSASDRGRQPPRP